MGNKTLLIVVDPVIKKTFKRACKEAHTPMNVAIQRFMIEYSKLDLKTRLKQNLEDLDRVVEEVVESKMEEVEQSSYGSAAYPGIDNLVFVSRLKE